MSTPEQLFDVDLEYPLGVIEEVPYIKCAFLPRIGELIHLKSGGSYRVKDVIHFDEHIISQKGETKVKLVLSESAGDNAVSFSRDEVVLMEKVCDMLDGYGGLEPIIDEFETLRRKINDAL
ncbi:hypothetical protein P0Y35_05835 [Kiritimatiellaeota bacterium B1221]|nr:hypothetical protein [Kiritimatiellaeota bacterium B1221]